MNRLERNHLSVVRSDLLTPLEGRILDVGAGTGVNFPYFRSPDQVMAIEPDPDRRRIALPKVLPGMTLLDCPADNVPLPSGSIDHVVFTLVLCSVSDLDASLGEMRRLLKPGGTVTFLEHVRGKGCHGALHDIATPLWSKVAGGCHLNRDTPAILEQHGFPLESCVQVCRVLGVPFVAGRARQPD